MRRAMVSGVVTGEVSVTHWPIFFLSPITVPEIFAKVGPVSLPFFPVLSFVSLHARLAPLFEVAHENRSLLG